MVKGFLVHSTRQRLKIKIGKFVILTNLAVAVLSPVDWFRFNLKIIILQIPNIFHQGPALLHFSEGTLFDFSVLKSPS